MFTVKKGQTVDFRSPKVPSYLKETKAITRELIDHLEEEKGASLCKGTFLKKPVKVPAGQRAEVRHPLLWNKIKKARNATHQER
jgi:hypothetical protein